MSDSRRRVEHEGRLGDVFWTDSGLSDGIRNKSVFGSVFGWKMFHKLKLEILYRSILITVHYV